ncbi:partitioning defective 3 [Schistosoma japonicum]|nr:partitioning defective 3 [Schistosoma japonicum]
MDDRVNKNTSIKEKKQGSMLKLPITMKVTVCFDDVKVVVPCGNGDILIRELAEMALLRFQKSTASLLHMFLICYFAKDGV